MQKHQLYMVVTDEAKKINEGIPAIIVRDEKELEQISSELGKIFFADVNRLSNGVVIIKTPAR